MKCELKHENKSSPFPRTFGPKTWVRVMHSKHGVYGKRSKHLGCTGLNQTPFPSQCAMPKRRQEPPKLQARCREKGRSEAHRRGVHTRPGRRPAAGTHGEGCRSGGGRRACGSGRSQEGSDMSPLRQARVKIVPAHGGASENPGTALTPLTSKQAPLLGGPFPSKPPRCREPAPPRQGRTCECSSICISARTKTKAT